MTETEDPQAGPKMNRTLVTIFVMVAPLLQSLDSTIANVALPYMQGTMSASQDQINWVLTSYIVAAAVMTAPVGYLAGRFGRTRLFVASVIGFTISSVMCGMSNSLEEIVIFRVLQGIAGAALVPLSQSVMFDIYPVEKRGQAMSVWGMGVTLGPIVGPVLGGWLTDHYTWRWVFYINVPFGIIAAIGLMIFLHDTKRNPGLKLDWIGFGALSLAIGAFQTLLDRGETLDWFSSPEIVIEACLAGTGLYVFLVQSSLAPKPFLSPRLVADVNFVVGTVLYFVIGLILYSTLALQAPYLQHMMDYPVTSAGLILAPRGLGSMTSMVCAGRLVGRVSPRTLIMIGLVLTAVALYEMMHWTPQVSRETIIWVGFLQGFSIGFVAIPLSVVAFATLPAELRTEGTGVYSLMRNLGSSIGISITGALLVSNTQINHAILAAHLTPFDRTLQSGAGQLLERHALLLNDEVTRQAQIIAYGDDFKLMFLLALLSVPLVLLTRRQHKV